MAAFDADRPHAEMTGSAPARREPPAPFEAGRQ